MAIRCVPPGQRFTAPKAASKRPARPRPRSALVPTATRTATALTERELDLSGDAIETFAKAVGGRAKLLQVLAISDTDNSTDKVVNCLLDDEFDSWSLRKICTYAGITIADLFASYKKALFVQAHIEAAHLITRRLPPIIADVMERALPGTAECPRCHGIPTTLDCPPCPQCEGSGTIPTEPDLDRQKLALELGRLLERKAGVVMQQNNLATATAALANPASPGSLEQLQQAVGELLFSPSRRRALAPVVDVEVSPVQDPREPAHPREEPRRDVPLPISEPEEDDNGDEDDEEDEDEPLDTRT